MDMTSEDVNNLIQAHSDLFTKDLTEMTKSASEEEEQEDAGE